ncbi:C4b-binding protein alpha chain [Acomys russatus]|uniref:C4b-binding protein alpha chain n=1 Tax=Acomys russatus TaxID=60746 RepID=UPI0021E27D27|nr:C4b-binding protein alpha chain [Acomys russatus]
MLATKAPRGTLHKNREAAAWPFSRLCGVYGPTLFQMTVMAALWVAVFGKCGPPPDLTYAFPESETDQTDFESHTVLKYSCRPGYSRATSSQTIFCRPEGEWHISINCVKKSCRNPGDLQNGQVDVKTDFSFGAQIEFSCSKGYILVGSSTSYCEIQGKGVSWSDPFPECVIAKCGSPPDISNGKHNGGNEDFYTYGSSVTYSCDPSFTLSGNASLTCTVVNKTVGVWSPSPPTCENTCTNIPDIPHAHWLQTPKPKKEDVYEIGTVLHYRCDSGYKHATREPMTVICRKDLSWSLFKGCKGEFWFSKCVCILNVCVTGPCTLSECEICCPAPNLRSVRVVQHTKKYPKNGCAYFYDDTILYKCREAVLSATCKSDGTWHPQTPTCYQSCDFPPDIAHGHYTKSSSYYYGHRATYKCDEGYRLVGEATISCQLSQWTPAAPQCKALCRKPEIENGMLSPDKDQYIESENVTIQCYSGFDILGSHSISCSENGTWYPEVPQCEWVAPKDCEYVFTGKKMMQCLPSSNDVKMALEVYKLFLEIKLLETQIDKAK